nr:hypothetical protein [uncultured Enterocloster sp.]
MTMTVTFNSFDEMVDFARSLTGQVHGTAVQPVPVQETSQTSVPTAPAASAPAASVAPVPTAPATPAAVPTAPVTPAPAVPTSTHTYTPDELAKAAMPLMDAGKQQELIGLVHQFGASSIPELRPEQYGAFATALRGMGAQI